MYEVILAYHGAANDDCGAAVNDLCVNVLDCFVRLTNFVEKGKSKYTLPSIGAT